MPGVGGGANKPRFSAHYVGCCSLQPQYTGADLNQAVAQLREVNTHPVGVAIELSGGKVITYRFDLKKVLEGSCSILLCQEE